MSPSSVGVSPSSFRIVGPATAMFTRSMYAMKYIRHRTSRIRCLIFSPDRFAPVIRAPLRQENIRHGPPQGGHYLHTDTYARTLASVRLEADTTYAHMLFPPRLLFAAALVLLFVTSWIVLPAPNRLLLPLGVGAPEVSAWLVLGCLVVGGLTFGAAGRDRLGRATLVLAAVAVVLASMPLVQLPFVVRRFDGTMRRALGDDFLRDVPPDRRARMRPAPIVSFDLFIPFSLRGGNNAGEARVTRSIPFATPRGVPLTLDIHRPAATAGRYPSVVQIYGGAWQRGAPGDDARFAAYLAARGFVVFAIDYRHAPEWQWPAQIEDVRAALGWIR